MIVFAFVRAGSAGGIATFFLHKAWYNLTCIFVAFVFTVSAGGIAVVRGTLCGGRPSRRATSRTPSAGETCRVKKGGQLCWRVARPRGRPGAPFLAAGFCRRGEAGVSVAVLAMVSQRGWAGILIVRDRG